MTTPTLTLDPADAVELAELLAFLGDWFDDAPDVVGGWLARFACYGYTLDELRADLDRFGFLLGSGGQRLLGERADQSADR